MGSRFAALDVGFGAEGVQAMMKNGAQNGNELDKRVLCFGFRGLRVKIWSVGQAKGRKSWFLLYTIL